MAAKKQITKDNQKQTAATENEKAQYAQYVYDEQGNKVAIVKIDVAGDELLAERRCKTFEEAIDLCLDAIKKQIDKYKEKRR